MAVAESSEEESDTEELEEMPAIEVRQLSTFRKQKTTKPRVSLNLTQMTLAKILGIDDEVFADEELLEEHLVRRAARDMILPKFEVAEQSIFEDILGDVFLPGVGDAEKRDYRQSEVLETMVRHQFETRNLQKARWMLDKIMQMHDMVLVHNGIIVLGQHNAGKSTAINVLEAALNRSSANELDDEVLALKNKKALELPRPSPEELAKRFQLQRAAT